MSSLRRILQKYGETIGPRGFCRPNVKPLSVGVSRANQTAKKPGKVAKETKPKATPLYDFHVSHKAKMVDFAGWQMPLLYEDQSIIDSHLHTRKHVSIFDVSHMQQAIVSGNDRLEFLESVCVSDVKNCPENSGQLSLLTNEKGGIIDDMIFMNTSRGYLHIVLNAGCAKKDMEHLSRKVADYQRSGKAVQIAFLQSEERALLAVQGPEMAQVLEAGTSDSLIKLPFMHTTLTTLFNFKCRITRCGYTGEDGVEISCLAKDATPLCETLLASSKGKVKMAGLAARDSLRLEAGLCLYGNDIDEDVSPVEAALSWTIGKRRRNEGGFPGSEVILGQLKNGVSMKRVGIVSSGAPARQGYPVTDQEGKPIGKITSGCPSPTLGKNISMAYVETPSSKNGTKVNIRVRNQDVQGQVVKMPFVPANYYHAKGHVAA
ncbi:hypothetical protein RvY_09463 [Ramazzottius varieornatus]|uniref:Aminomethyltransferase n=1 Tax=Ramazzottius varieornatus TaxID=947166 RepID=A0A1D1V9E5_RAMVA|nr:hypothetical protein RvY_09463 [Ramazzottius varieornatus]